MSLPRLIQAGAIFAEKLDNLQRLRDRWAVTGNPTMVDSPYGPALTTDGTNDYITLGAGEEYRLRFDSGTQDFSVFARVKLVNPAVTANIISKLDGGVSDGWTFYIAAGRPTFWCGTKTITGAVGAVADTEWHDIAATIDRDGNGQIYVDGAPSGTPTAIGGEVIATTVHPVIGARAYDQASKLNGSIRDLGIIDRVLTPTEVSDITAGNVFDYEKNLVSAWSMSDVNPPDEGWRGLGNDGTGTGLVAATDIVDGIAGGKATEFDTTEYVDVSGFDVSGLMAAEGTTAFLVKFNTIANWMRVLSAESAPNTGWYVLQDNTGKIFITITSSTVGSVVIPTGIVVSEWMHVAFSWITDDRVCGFLNGELVAESTSFAGAIPSAGSLRIGGVLTTAGSLNGVLDTVRFYDTALTQLQATDLYARTRKGIVR